jgi:hypothetical protein
MNVRIASGGSWQRWVAVASSAVWSIPGKNELFQIDSNRFKLL